MRKILAIGTLMIAAWLVSCEVVLDPKPVNLLINDVALNEPNDVPIARIGLYSAFRGMASVKVLAGDFTADMLTHNGTFSQYREFGIKEITASNATAASLWGSIYSSVYVSNFILERLPDIPGVSSELRSQVLAEAHFIRGYAYFVGLTTFGKMPVVTSTNLDRNINIERSPEGELLTLIIADLEESLNGLPQTSINAGFLSVQATYAALARLALYYEEYDVAAQYATMVIESGEYVLEDNFLDVVNTDFSSEAILEVGYSAADDPGTSGTGLNNLFIGRREIIPSNEAIYALSRGESGDRFGVLGFDFDDLSGSDNGWSVLKYGTADQDNNNIIIYRLAEMYLIRAEANVELNKLQAAEDDINVLRNRANAPTISFVSLTQMRDVVEKERLYELAYEGHRWYDLRRTGRLDAVMNAFSPNWRTAYHLWPVPLRETQLNPALANDQNPGY